MRASSRILRLRGSRGVRFVLSVHRRFAESDGGTLANSISYAAFLSLFPLLLLSASLAGFVLANAPHLRDEWVRALRDAIPGLGTAFPDGVDALVEHRALSGVIALVGLAWSGTGVVRAVRHALARIHRIDEPTGVRAMLRPMLALAVIGGLALASIGVSIVVASITLPGVGRALGFIIVWAADVLTFAVAFHWLTRPYGPPFTKLLPGAVMAGSGWSIVRLAGVWFMGYTIERAAKTYGLFAAAVGILVVLAIASKLFLYGAALNAVVSEQSGDDSARAIARAFGPGDPRVTDDGEGRRSYGPSTASTRRASHPRPHHH